MKFLCIDPGGTVGYAVFDSSSNMPMMMGECKRGPEFFQLLADIDVDFYVVENWRVRPEIAHGKKIERYSPKWDEALTARDIGAVELYAHQTGRAVVIQETSIKAIAAAWYGLPNDRDHKMNAVLHGCYYSTKELGHAPPNNEVSSADAPGERVRRPARVAQISSYQGLRAARRSASVEVPEQGEEG